ncbi:hypothetical protein GCM10011612_02320 [Actinomyces gaoshouyii]|uniref:Uncharacterized protein n=1 Tax=Actinomyces gaoshouyii TaxID=1960083 RepID=A0A8H9HBN0_9ACTO|nr:hypothetical protein GCM10011612_02320 [Actinomyces gaoshouyii]
MDWANASHDVMLEKGILKLRHFLLSQGPTRTPLATKMLHEERGAGRGPAERVSLRLTPGGRGSVLSSSGRDRVDGSQLPELLEALEAEPADGDRDPEGYQAVDDGG